MSALEASIENESRHAIFVNRFAGGLANEFLPFLNELKLQISFELNNNPTPTSQRKLNALITHITKIQQSIYSEYETDLFRQLELFTSHEAGFEIDSLNDVIESTSIELELPSDEQLISAVKSRPLVFPDSNDVVLLDPFIKNWSASEINRVSSVIRTGFAMGETNQQIAKKIAGKNGTLDKQTRRNNKAIVRTSVNHVSTEARHKTMEQNSDIVIGYEWVSTLDGRTSSQCKSLDGKIFLFKNKGFKPKPPIHPNCRSITSPVLDKRFNLDDEIGKRGAIGSDGRGQVSADVTYYSFLKKQTAKFQDETLGKTRGQLFRSGGLTSEEFAKLTVDQRYRPLTLDEMKAKNPMAFEKANL